MTVNLAIIGIGRIGKIHANSIFTNPNARLVGFFDENNSEIKNFSEKYNSDFLDIKTIENDHNIDAVVICSPTDTHIDLIKKFSRKIPILKAGNMSLGINLLMYLTEIASKSLGNNFLSKVYEVHHKHKIDYPSGTALMLGKGIADGKNKNFYNLIGRKYLNKKSFPYAKKINFNSIRKGEVIGEHEVRFSSGKEIIKLNHESFDRALYSEGAITAAKWLFNKKPGLYSMRNLLNFK